MYNPSKSSWLNPNIEYLFNAEIIEYDMRDAGFTIIKQFQLLDSDQIKNLSRLDKDERTRAIGKLQINNKVLAEALKERFAEMRSSFITANQIFSHEIISVKNDALFIIGVKERLKFGRVEFAMKHQYSSYVRFIDNNNIEIYYRDGEMDIKGIGERGINRHRLYLLNFINRVMGDIEAKNPSLKRFMKKFIDDFKTGKLDDEYYLEFNNVSRDANALHNFQKLIIPLIQIIQKEMG